MKIHKIFKRPSELNKITVFYFILFVLIGLIQSYNNRNYIYSDLISYLDIGDNIYNHGISNVLNAFWSPLYPAIVGFVLKILNPASYYESSVVYGLNFIIFIISFLCFVYFINGLISYLKEKDLIKKDTEKNLSSILYFISYSLFLFAAIEWLRSNDRSVTAVPADTLVSCFVFLAFGCILRMIIHNSSKRNYFLLGIFLAFGYLAKTFMFPFGIVIFLLLLLFRKVNSRYLFISVIIFIVFSGSWIYSISKAKGYFTIGDAGKLNYAWCVNLLRPSFIHWQGLRGTDNMPVHPTRVIHHDPDVYEFTAPVAGSYPPFYDMSYWNEGMKIKLDLHQQYIAIKSNIVLYWRYSWLLIIAALILIIITLNKKGRKEHFSFTRSNLFLLMASAAALMMYLLINIEPRYVAAFLLIFFVLVFFSAVLALQKQNMKVAILFASFVCAFLVVKETASIYRSTKDSIENKNGNALYKVAEYLKQNDIKQGDEVADVGIGYNAYWARLAGVRIISDIAPFDPEIFWESDSLKKSEIYDLLREKNVKAIISNELMKAPGDNEWKNVTGTEYYVMILR